VIHPCGHRTPNRGGLEPREQEEPLPRGRGVGGRQIVHAASAVPRQASADGSTVLNRRFRLRARSSAATAGESRAQIGRRIAGVGEEAAGGPVDAREDRPRRTLHRLRRHLAPEGREAIEQAAGVAGGARGPAKILVQK